jgi:hypothetical protein
VRPLARRALRMARPARVFMRARKPCLRARRRLFGWYVRFTPTSGGFGHHRQHDINVVGTATRRTPERVPTCQGYGLAGTGNNRIHNMTTAGGRARSRRPRRSPNGGSVDRSRTLTRPHDVDNDVDERWWDDRRCR